MNAQYPPQGQYPSQGQWPQQYPQGQPQAQAPAQNLGSVADLIQNAGKTPQAFSKHTPFGTSVSGEIVETAVRQSIDFKSGQPEFWPDHNPKLKLMIVIQTNQTDPTIPNDDGRRAVWVKWWGEQRQALLEAIKAAGDDDIRVGGKFMATLTGDRPNEFDPKLDNIKMYTYQYQKPTPGAGLAGLPGGQDMSQPQAQAQPPQGQYQQPPQAAPPVQAQAQAPAQDPWTGGPPQDGAQAALAQQQANAQAQGQAPQAQAPQAQAPQAQAPQAQAPQAGPSQAEQVEAQVRKFITLGLGDEEIAGAAGTTVDHVQQIRAAG